MTPMSDSPPTSDTPDRKGDEAIFASARWYDIGINWTARLEREMPLLREVFGEPRGRRILDAGCGPGHHVAAMARIGFNLTGLDASDEMLELARKRAKDAGVAAEFIHARFDQLSPNSHSFDGIFCLGNALAAGGDADLARRGVASLGAALAAGGRLVVQTLNFEKLRAESPAVRGPRVTRVDGVCYISTRVYSFVGDQVCVTNVTVYEAGGEWKKFASSGSLYPLSPGRLREWLAESGLEVERQYGGYDRSDFDAESSNDLITVAIKKSE